MVTRRALAPLVAAVLLIGGASIASGQRPGMGPRPGGGGLPMGDGPGGGMRGPSGPPVALSFQWIDVHVHLIADRQTADYRGAAAAAVMAMNEAGISKAVVMPPPQPGGSRAFDFEGFAGSLTPRNRFAFLGGDQFFVSPAVRGGNAADTFAQRAPIARQHGRAPRGAAAGHRAEDRC